MSGQYSTEEIKDKCKRGQVLSSTADFIDGEVIIKIGSTINYYSRQPDNSWFNYHCRTRY